jgi:hypothetical protein
MMTLDKLPEFLENLKEMQNKSVFVGIPHDKDNRTTDNKTNAMIGMEQEYGSAIKNIPPRPFLIPGIKDAQEKIAEVLKDGAKAALHGESIEKSLHKAGLIGQNSVKNKIVNGTFAPLAESTLAARRRARKNGISGTKPLIDTGQLLASISYVVIDDA